MKSADHTLENPAEDAPDAEWLTDQPVAFGAAIGQRHAPRRILQKRRVQPPPITGE